MKVTDGFIDFFDMEECTCEGVIISGGYKRNSLLPSEIEKLSPYWTKIKLTNGQTKSNDL